MTKTPIAVLGIDLGKNSCSLAGLDATGAIVTRRKMTRDGVVAFAAALPPCVRKGYGLSDQHFSNFGEAQSHEV